MPERLDRVRIDLSGELVEITWAERDELVKRLRIVTGDKTIIRRFKVAGASRPVELDDVQLGRLRMALDLWQADARGDLPEGIARLLAALTEAPDDDRAPGG